MRKTTFIPLKWKIGLFTVIILLITVLLVGYVALSELEQSYTEQVLSGAEENFIRSQFAIDYAVRRLEEDTRFLTDSKLVNTKLTRIWDTGLRIWDGNIFDTALMTQGNYLNPDVDSVPYWMGIIGSWFSQWISEKTDYLNIRYLRLNNNQDWEELIQVSLPSRIGGETSQPIVQPPPPSTRDSYPIVQDLGWLDGELQAGQSLLSPVRLFNMKNSGNGLIPVITAVAPVFRPNDSQLFGIIAIDMSIKSLVDNLIKNSQPAVDDSSSNLEEWRAITDENGIYLARSDMPVQGQRSIMEDFPRLARPTDDAYQLSKELDGQIGQFRKIDYGNGRRIGLLWAIPYPALKQQFLQKDSTWKIRVFALLLISGSGLIAVLLIHFLMAPLYTITRATRSFARRDYDASHLPVKTLQRQDEIGVLAKAFKTMVERIRSDDEKLTEANHKLNQANQYLETQVWERTKALEQQKARSAQEKHRVGHRQRQHSQGQSRQG